MMASPARVAFALALIVAALYGLNWLLQRYLLWLLLMSLFVWTGCASVAHAAPPAPPTVVQCEAVATTGEIVIFRCQPDNGPSVYVNSVGFMFLGD